MTDNTSTDLIVTENKTENTNETHIPQIIDYYETDNPTVMQCIKHGQPSGLIITYGNNFPTQTLSCEITFLIHSTDMYIRGGKVISKEEFDIKPEPYKPYKSVIPKTWFYSKPIKTLAMENILERRKKADPNFDIKVLLDETDDYEVIRFFNQKKVWMKLTRKNLISGEEKHKNAKEIIELYDEIFREYKAINPEFERQIQINKERCISYPMRCGMDL